MDEPVESRAVFLSAGMRTQVPGRQVETDDDGRLGGAAQLEVSVEFWPSWCLIAVDHVQLAGAARKKLLVAMEEGDEEAKGQALEAELRAVMVAIAACAFTLDAVHASVKSQLTTHPDYTDDFSRSAQVTEVLRWGFNIPHDTFEKIQSEVNAVFHIRNASVRAPLEFQPLLPHPVLKSAAARPFVDYRYETAWDALDATLQILDFLRKHPRDSQPGIVEWAERLADPLAEVNAHRSKGVDNT